LYDITLESATRFTHPIERLTVREMGEEVVMPDQRPVPAYRIKINKDASRNDRGKHSLSVGCSLASLNTGLGQVATPLWP